MLVGLSIVGVCWVCRLACFIPFRCSSAGFALRQGSLRQVVGLVLAQRCRESFQDIFGVRLCEAAELFPSTCPGKATSRQFARGQRGSLHCVSEVAIAAFRGVGEGGGDLSERALWLSRGLAPCAFSRPTAGHFLVLGNVRVSVKEF